MKIETQLPQPLAPTLSERPLDKPVEQTTTRPVDKSKPSDASTDSPQQETASNPAAPDSPANRVQNASTEPAAVGDLLDVIV